MRIPKPKEDLELPKVTPVDLWPQGPSLLKREIQYQQRGSRGVGEGWALTYFSLVDHELSIGQRHKHLVIQIPRQGKGVIKGFKKPKEITWAQGIADGMAMVPETPPPPTPCSLGDGHLSLRRGSDLHKDMMCERHG